MSDYITPPIVTDPDALNALYISFIQAVFPGWNPNDGSLAPTLGAAMARIAALDATQSATVVTAIFRFLGPLHGINPLNATAASVTATMTTVDDAGYTIPAGTLVGISAAGDTVVQFATAADVVVAMGNTSTATGGVTLVAIQPGAAGSGLGGIGITAQLTTTLAFVSTVTLAGSTTGGVDAETDQAFLNRLAAELRLQSPRPILPGDFAAIALNTPGVGRALAIDLYQPAVNEVQTLTVSATSGTFTISFGGHTSAAIAYNATAAAVQAALVLNSSIGAGGVSCTGGPLATNPVTVTFVGPNAGTNEANMTTTPSLSGGASTATVAGITNGAAAVTNQARCNTTALADTSGQPVASGIKAAVLAAQTAAREVNFLPFVIDPTYNEIDVTYEITAYAGFDPDAVVASVDLALASFLNPANWGTAGTGTGAPAGWTDNEKVRLLDLAAVIKNVPGVFAIPTLELCIHGGSPSTSDVTLTGPAPLTTVGTISGSHT